MTQAFHSWCGPLPADAEVDQLLHPSRFYPAEVVADELLTVGSGGRFSRHGRRTPAQSAPICRCDAHL